MQMKHNFIQLNKNNVLTEAFRYLIKVQILKNIIV